MATAGATTGGVQDDEKTLLLDWMARQNDVSAALMLRAISATHLVKERRGFGQTIRPAPGSVLASPALGSWDPDPDYFFHWLRDSALVIDALRHVIAEGAFAGNGLSRFKEFVAFSLSLTRLDGAGILRLGGDFRKNIDPFFLQFVRDDGDLRKITGDRVLGEPRFNPDGTLDISKWSRPQHDGPALRALALMRFWPLDGLDGQARASMRALILTDLEFIVRHWREPCFDIWEEELGHHYYTRLVHHAALADGVQWLEESGTDETARTQACWAAAQEIAKSLDEYWCPTKGFYASRRSVANGVAGKELDFATILAVIHAARGKGAHGVLDPRVMATLARLEELFDASYAINRHRPETRGPAMGRYAGDRYFSGGAYYFSTLGVAEFYYALAEAVAGVEVPATADNKEFLLRLDAAEDSLALPPPAPEHRKRRFEALLRRGDQFMATVAAYTPAGGELSEQFDQTTGVQASTKSLAWSHAALITAFARRKAAMRAGGIKLSQSGAAP
ncbi:MAG: glycoside hydrolase family 15 protein [Pseudomonadota bacterium]|nr:glycoside hydrolase family 15 protein [Pseudomonadota bacterium]